MKTSEVLKFGIPFVVVGGLVFAAGGALGLSLGGVQRGIAAHKASVAQAKAKAGPADAIVSQWDVSSLDASRPAVKVSAVAEARAKATPALVAAYCALPAAQRQNGEGPTCGGLGQLADSTQGMSVGAYYAAEAAICASGGDCSATQKLVDDTCQMAGKGSECEADGMAATKAYAMKEDFNNVISALCESGNSNYCDRGGL